MKLTILGSYGPFPEAGGTCSGYLLEQDGCYILLDCGNGVLSRLQFYIGLDKLSAVIISHLHSDHISDLFILRYALQLAFDNGFRNLPLKIFSPAEPEAEFARFSSYKDIFDIEIIAENKQFEIGSLQFSFLQTVHSVPSYAVSVSHHNRKKIVYSSDTEYFPQLSNYAENAPLFLCESNLLAADLQKGKINHLSASQAAKLAREGRVKQLLLTHLFPYRDPQAYLKEAAAIFPAAELAREGKTYRVADI